VQLNSVIVWRHITWTVAHTTRCRIVWTMPCRSRSKTSKAGAKSSTFIFTETPRLTPIDNQSENITANNKVSNNCVGGKYQPGSYCTDMSLCEQIESFINPGVIVQTCHYVNQWRQVSTLELVYKQVIMWTNTSKCQPGSSCTDKSLCEPIEACTSPGVSV